MDKIITPLDQEIAKILIATSDKSRIIDGLIALLRTKQEEIDLGTNNQITR
jgi:hypothetical protein